MNDNDEGRFDELDARLISIDCRLDRIEALLKQLIELFHNAPPSPAPGADQG